MNQPKPATANKLLRYLGPVIGLVVAAIYLYTQFGPASLPACDASETRSTLSDLVAQTETGDERAKLAGIEQASEAAFDEAKELRTCAALAKFEGGTEEKLAYTVSWNDKDDRKFLVELRRLPRCAGNDVQGSLAELIADFEQQTGTRRALSAVAQIAQAGLDTQKEERSCTGVATFGDGSEAKLSYVVRWGDPEKTRYAVEAQYDR